MKRDWNLCREILLRTESLTKEEKAWLRRERMEETWAIPKKTKEAIGYHFSLLSTMPNQAGLLILREDGFPVRLTAEGHDFVDAFREDHIWHRCLDYLKERQAAVTLKTLHFARLNIEKEP